MGSGEWGVGRKFHFLSPLPIPHSLLPTPLYQSIRNFQSRLDVAEFQPVAVADDDPAAGFERHAVDKSPVAAGAVRQEKIAVLGERQGRMEIRDRRIVDDQGVRAVAPYSYRFGVASDARPQNTRTAFDLKNDLDSSALRPPRRLPRRLSRRLPRRLRRRGRVLRDDGGFGFAEAGSDLEAAGEGVVDDPDLNLAERRVTAVVNVFVNVRVQLALQEFAARSSHSRVGFVIVAKLDQVRREQARVFALQVVFDRPLDERPERGQIGARAAFKPAASAQREIDRGADSLE